MGAISKEDVEQIKIVEWVKQCTDLPIIHIANQRQTSPQHGSLLKRMGVLPGTSDLFFPRMSKGKSGLWIELKVGSNKPTELQIKFIENMKKEGYEGIVCWGADESIKFIKNFYHLPDINTPVNRM